MAIKYEQEKQRVERRLHYAPFFKSLFTTFGVTILLFMALVFILFIVLWLRS